MRATAEFVRQRFGEFNRLYFNSELPEIPIRITSAKSYLGKVVYERRRGLTGKTRAVNFRLLISRCLDLEERVVEDTIIHEMIHYWILYKGIKDTGPHGRVFRGFMQTFNSVHGRNITVRHKITTEDRAESLEARKGVIVCVARLSDGRTGITVAMPSRVVWLMRELPRFSLIRSSRWYYVSHPFFAHFPKARTVKVYPVKSDELLDAMADARELVWEEDRLVVSRNGFDPSVI